MLIIDEIDSRQTNNRTEAIARITANGHEYRVWFRWKGAMCPTPADAYLAAGIQPAMCLGGKLIVKGSVSERLLKNLPKIQETYLRRYPTLSPLNVEVDDVRPWNPKPDHLPAQAPRNVVCKRGTKTGLVGTLFSGGVDSFYSVLKHLDEIRSLVFIHGFDISLNDQQLRKHVSESLRNAASKLRKPLIEVETNIRQFSDRYVAWNPYHPQVLVAVGIILSGCLSKLHIPSSWSYSDLEYMERLNIVINMDPATAPLFSTDRIEFAHDGCESTRIEKCKAIAENDVAMETLRVCWLNPGGAYNCGRCEKCLRTMVNLRIAGALERCKTFNLSLNPKKVLAIAGKKNPYNMIIRQNIEMGERLGTDPELLSALRLSLTRRINIQPRWLLFQAYELALAARRHYYRKWT
ncbi:hypothetical protein ACFL03_07225 [Thermodesulfobacteriota bacterium]